MRFNVLDSFRGLCALFVVVFHAPFLWHGSDNEFVKHSYLFVDFFFVLSGFVITFAYEDRLDSCRQVTRFIFRRIGRLWPLHVFILGLFVGIELLKLILIATTSYSPQAAPFAGANSIPAIFSHLLFLHSLNVHDSTTWNVPSWSISAEFYTYIVFAAVCLFVVQKRAFVFALLCGFACLGLYMWSDSYIGATHDYGFLRCVYGFLIGVFAYKLHLLINEKIQEVKSCSIVNGVELAAFFSIFVFVSLLQNSAVSLLAPFFFAFIVVVFSFEKGVVSKAMNTGPMVFIGMLSYSIYMVHAFVNVVIHRVSYLMEFKLGLHIHSVVNKSLLDFGNIFLMDMVLFMYLICIVLFSWATYSFVELPGKKFFYSRMS